MQSYCKYNIQRYTNYTNLKKKIEEKNLEEYFPGKKVPSVFVNICPLCGEQQNAQVA